MEKYKQYRTPRVEEFIQGFEFEYLQRSGGGSYFYMINEDGSLCTEEDCKKQVEKNRQPIVEEWIPLKVWWKPETLEEAKKTSGLITWFICPFDAPISKERSVKNRTVRVKI